MSKLDWEKRNSSERPKTKRRTSNRTKVISAYENGTKRERERIVRALEIALEGGGKGSWKLAIELIKGQQ
jgi:hypothetical protein